MQQSGLIFLVVWVIVIFNDVAREEIWRSDRTFAARLLPQNHGVRRECVSVTG